MKLPSKLYDWLKWICLIVLPALSWAYSELSSIWGLPFGIEIPKTITIIATFLGILIGVSTYSYNKIQNGIQELQNDDMDSKN